MSPQNLLSLPAVTAVNRLICGYYDGAENIGVCVATHAQLDDFFGESGIAVADQPSIAKKARATINRANSSPSEHDKLRRLIEQIADPRFYTGTRHERTLAYLNPLIRADGLEVRKIGENYRLVAIASTSLAASALSNKASTYDLDSVQREVDRAISQVDSDPAGAITAACSLVESVCKCILDELGKPLPASKDIKGLYGEVAAHLNLSPARKDIPVEWEADVRAILSGLFTISGGIGALRTHAGDAHGRGKRPVPVDSRTARLAVHAASTISLFLIETWARSRK